MARRCSGAPKDLSADSDRSENAIEKDRFLWYHNLVMSRITAVLGVHYEKGKVEIMVDVNQIMFDMIRKSGSVATSSVNEIEEIVDTGLEKTEDNIQKHFSNQIMEEQQNFMKNVLI